MLNTSQRVKLYAHCYTRSEAIVTHGVRVYAYSFTWNENLCSFYTWCEA